MKKKGGKLSQKDALLKHGVRSGLEERVCQQLIDAGVEYEYESMKIEYIRPASKHIYTPDIVLSNGIIVETKGRFLMADRQKHILVKKHNPTLDIRFVFSNSNARISKTSRTTYAQWCIKNGFKFSDKEIPKEWMEE